MAQTMRGLVQTTDQDMRPQVRLPDLDIREWDFQRGVDIHFLRQDHQQDYQRDYRRDYRRDLRLLVLEEDFKITCQIRMDTRIIHQRLTHQTRTDISAEVRA